MDDEVIDILAEPTEKQRRKEIRNIKDSYSHPWDVLAELLQNSVDAIRRYDAEGKPNRDHLIEIKIDCVEKSIEVSDTGVGFPKSKLKELLNPHGTDKESHSDEIGQKGIGLKFAIFSSDGFHLQSFGSDGPIDGTISGALSWVDRGLGGRPKFVPNPRPKAGRSEAGPYTRITLEKVENSREKGDGIFDLPTSLLVAVIRTKTAVGSTRPLFGLPQEKVKVTLSHRRRGKTWVTEDVPYSYLAPTELIKEKDKFDLPTFITRAATLNDRQKARQLRGKALYELGRIDRAGRDLRYFACFFPKRDTWKDIRKAIGEYVSDEESGDGTQGFESILNRGIYLSTRGMPTGVSLVPPTTGNAVYWENVFFLMEDDSLEFDLGRKSVPGRTQGMLRDIARTEFNKLSKFGLIAAGKPEIHAGAPALQEQARKQQFQDLDHLADLGISKIPFLKNPDGQEAGVVAIFHELVAAGLLKGYYTLRQGYKSTYDLWGKYAIEAKELGSNARKDLPARISTDLIIEFKFDAAEIIPDVDENRKFFEDIDLIVCWDLNEVKFAAGEIQVRPLPAEEVFYYGSNYLLEWPGAMDLGRRGSKPVLALRKFVTDYRAK
jgi:molecular chaperone HtpG